jgi:hypothetical protein
MAQEKLLGRLALPGGLFTSSRHTYILASTDLLHPNLLATVYAPFESLLAIVLTLS